jgi:hypothetical protein
VFSGVNPSKQTAQMSGSSAWVSEQLATTTAGVTTSLVTFLNMLLMPFVTALVTTFILGDEPKIDDMLYIRLGLIVDGCSV